MNTLKRMRDMKRACRQLGPNDAFSSSLETSKRKFLPLASTMVVSQEVTKTRQSIITF